MGGGGGDNSILLRSGRRLVGEGLMNSKFVVT